MKARNRNELWGRILLDELARAGVRELIVSPGSRSAPVVLAAADDPRFRIHVQIDERAAGFVALGVGKAGGSPAAVLTTSGSAVANLFPAVVEAAQAEVPLLVLTADRPPRLRGADANQTIDQTKIFGGYVRRFEELSPAEATGLAVRHLRSTVCRALAAAVGLPGGPVHLNLAFAKPLEPVEVPGDPSPELVSGGSESVRGRDGGAPWTRVTLRRSTVLPEHLASFSDALAGARRPVLVAGVLPDGFGASSAVVRLAAARMGIPLLADPLSGVRYPTGMPGDAEPANPGTGGGTSAPHDSPTGHAEGDAPSVIGGYSIALRDPSVRQALRPDLVIRIGGSPTSGVLSGWLDGSELEGVPQLLVDGGGRWKDHAGAVTEVIPSDPGDLFSAVANRVKAENRKDAWTGRWMRVEDEVRRGVALHATDVARDPFEGSIVAAVVDRIGQGTSLFVSSSMPVREVDTFVPFRHAPLVMRGNRGASGIDGILSSAAGLSLATGKRVLALVGDLALLHDSNGLASLRAPGIHVSVVVLNNDGGGIFHMLPIHEHEPAFTPYFATPHGRELKHLSALHGLPHLEVECRSAFRATEEAGLFGLAGVRSRLDELLALDGSGVLEIRTDRNENRRRRDMALSDIAAMAADALTEGER